MLDLFKAIRRERNARAAMQGAIAANWTINLAPGVTWDQAMTKRAYEIADQMEKTRSLDLSKDLVPSLPVEPLVTPEHAPAVDPEVVDVEVK